ncbi:hypothetical protein M8J75_014800 [Diaphorina citri]|nr:hypothetical protein M8J75_014800 [Diaphorina citri]KAI5714829.1 hypothetical protein M8J77_006149 [Diaphorina citri]
MADQLRNATFTSRELRRIQYMCIRDYDDSQLVTKNMYWHYANNKTYERILHDNWYEDDHCVAVRDVEGVGPIDFLVIPKKEIEDMNSVTRDDAWLMGHLMWVAHHMAETMGLYKGYRVVLNYGPDSHNFMSQFHLRVLGGLPLMWPPFEPTTLFPTTTQTTTGRRRTKTTVVDYTFDKAFYEESRFDKSVPWRELPMQL